jgi:hypothetical protein
MEGISLGWNCESAIKGVEMGIRKRKSDGYQTCPFDECLTNYDGIILCLQEDFRYFCDPHYLKLLTVPFSTGGIVRGETLIYHARYHFLFNHESPGHGNLYLTQNWSGGKNHYIDNGFEKFIERYTRRIHHFREYLRSSVHFIIGTFLPNINELEDVLNKTYPTLEFQIYHYRPSVDEKMFYEHQYLMLHSYKT